MQLTNAGARDGAEVVQLYLGATAPSLPRPVRELKAFRKLWLRAGESQRVEFELPLRTLAYYCPDSLCWRVDDGEYEIALGSSSRDLRLRARVCHASNQQRA